MLVVAFIIVQRQKSTKNLSGEENSILSEIPTGVVVPTQNIQPNELDIVSIDPKDKVQEVGLNTPIIITFSKAFQMNDIEFYISPNTPSSLEIKVTKLIIRPTEAWIPGTLYAYSINISADVSKVRLYSFTTTGPTTIGYPDTAPEDYFQAELQKQKKERTDLYVSNQTPFETNIFSVSSDYTVEQPAHFYFTIVSKITDQNRLKQEVDVWLQSLDLTQDQISNLDIRYQ